MSTTGFILIDGIKAKLCRFCDQPMKPKNVKKFPDEWDHACGCRYHRHTPYCPHTIQKAGSR